MVLISIISSLSFSSSSFKASSDFGRFSLNQPREKSVGQDSFNFAKASAFSCSRTSLSIFLQNVNSRGLSELEEQLVLAEIFLLKHKPYCEARHNDCVFVDLIRIIELKHFIVVYQNIWLLKQILLL